MTVPVQIPVTASTANGLTNVFPYGFKIAAAEDLAVTVDGVRLTSGYTVSGVGDPAGGNVIITAAPANGAKVVRYLAPILKRETDYQQFGDWMAAIVNLDIDRIWLVLQTLQQNDIRSLKLPVDTTTDQVIAQDAAARVGKIVSFDASGNMTLLVPADLSLHTVSSFIATLLDDADAATARATLGLVIGTDIQAFAAPASQAEMVSGTEPGLRTMSPLRIAQAIAALGSNSTDIVARDQIALTNLRQLLNTAVATGALVQGKQWELATDEWGGTSTNQTYIAGSPNYYSNPAYSTSVYPLTAGMLSQSGLSLFVAAQCVDGNTGTNGFHTDTAGIGSYLQIDLGAGVAVQFEMARVNVAGAVTAIWDVEYSDNGSSWTKAAVGLDASGAAGWKQITWTGSTAGAHRYWRLYKTNGAAGGNYHTEIEFTRSATAAPNMTLIPPAAVSVSSAPSYMDAYFLWKDDSGSAVLGTDLTVELSRDNGTTWTTATITNLTGVGGFDGTYSGIKARANVGSQPSGTSLKARIKTLNNKAQRIAAPALYAE